MKIRKFRTGPATNYWTKLEVSETCNFISDQTKWDIKSIIIKESINVEGVLGHTGSVTLNKNADVK